MVVKYICQVKASSCFVDESGQGIGVQVQSQSGKKQDGFTAICYKLVPAGFSCNIGLQCDSSNKWNMLQQHLVGCQGDDMILGSLQGDATAFNGPLNEDQL